MTDVDFKVRNGLIVNTNLIFAAGGSGQVGINTNSVDSGVAFKINGAANITGSFTLGSTLVANGSNGSQGYVLYSNGSTGSPYWGAITGPTNYTFSTGLTNSSGTITVNPSYIATISANSASYLGTTPASAVINATTLASYGYVNSTSGTAAAANNATYLGTAPASSYVNTTANYTIAGNLNFTGTGSTINYGAGAFSIGYRDIPQNIQNSNYTTVLTDAGGHIFNASNSASLTYTVANNLNAAYSNGAAITIINGNTGIITIAGGTGVSLQLSGTTTTGNRTLSPGAVATCIRVAADRWFVGGSGIS